jgi:glucoamylase
MRPKLRKLFAVGILLLSLGGTVWATPFYMPVTFAIITNTSYGQSVFVVGSISQLGNWSPTNAIKLVPSNCTSSNCLWSITLGLPEGITYEYKFIKRDDCASRLRSKRCRT